MEEEDILLAPLNPLEVLETRPPSPLDDDDSVPRPLGKCSLRKCKVDDVVPDRCFHSKCEKLIHPTCCKEYVIKQHSLADLVDPINNQMYTVCSKTCYTKVQKSHIISSTTRLPWSKDGKNGTLDPNTSEKILLDWLLQEGNYNRYRGKGNNGKTKVSFAKDIQSQMESAEVRVKRSPETIMQKIADWESSYGKAKYWIDHTGQGVEDQTQFEDAVRKRFRHFYLLREVFGDRAKVAPAVTTATMDDSSASEDELASSAPSDTARSTAVARRHAPASNKKAKRMQATGDGVFEGLLAQLVDTSDQNAHSRALKDAADKAKTEMYKAKQLRALFRLKKEMEADGYTREEMLHISPQLAEVIPCKEPKQVPKGNAKEDEVYVASSNDSSSDNESDSD